MHRDAFETTASFVAMAIGKGSTPSAPEHPTRTREHAILHVHRRQCRRLLPYQASLHDSPISVTWLSLLSSRFTFLEFPIARLFPRGIQWRGAMEDRSFLASMVPREKTFLADGTWQGSHPGARPSPQVLDSDWSTQDLRQSSSGTNPAAPRPGSPVPRRL